MADFNGIGSSIDDNQIPYYFQDMIAAHAIDCPDPFKPLYQCSHCCLLETSDLAARPVSGLDAVSLYGTQEQNIPRPSSRTWAEVASNPPAVRVSLYTESPRPMPTQLLPPSEPQPARNAIPGNIYSVPAVQRRTYAQVAQAPSQQPVWPYRNDLLQPRLSHSYNTTINHRTRIPRHRYIHGNGHTQLQQSFPHPTAGYDRRTNQLLRLPRPQEGMPMPSSTSSDPRNVNTFVQATHFGGHRPGSYPPSSALDVTNNNSSSSYNSSSSHNLTPASPGASSIASSQWSRPSSISSRRTGEALHDPSLPHHCPECRTTFAKADDLRRHITRSHSALASRPYRCPHAPACPWAFVHPKDLRRHSRTHVAPQQVPRFSCPHAPCAKSYTREDNLARHIGKAHRGEDAAFASASGSASASASLMGWDGEARDEFEGEWRQGV